MKYIFVYSLCGYSSMINAFNNVTGVSHMSTGIKLGVWSENYVYHR